MEIDSERSAFEAWATKKKSKNEGAFYIRKTQRGSYINAETKCAWEAWKARAASGQGKSP